jgi:PAS domain S-box-containing protein
VRAFDRARPTFSFVLADWLEQLTPGLIRRFERRSKDGPAPAPVRQAIDRLPHLLEALVQGLREHSVPTAPAAADTDSSFDVDADVAVLHLLEQVVYDEIEARAPPVPLRDMVLLGRWFARRIETVVRAESGRFAAMLDAIPDHLLLTDREGHLVYANHAATQFLSSVTALPPEHLLGQDVTDRLPERYRAHSDELFARVHSGDIVTEEFLFERSWREHHATPVRDAHGNVRAVAIASRDISKRKIAEARLQLLAKVGTLAATRDYETLLTAVARLSIPEVADWCCIDVVENGRILRGRVAHRDPKKAAVAEQIRCFSPEHENPRIAEELLAGKSFVFDQTLSVPDLALQDVARHLGARSLMLVPIVVFGATTAIAAFVFGPESGRHHDENDLALAQEVARRVGQLIENARLHDELRRSEARFRVALADSRIAVFEEDADFRVRWIYNVRFGEGTATDSCEVARRFEASPDLVAIKRRVLDTGEGASVAADIDVDGERRHLIVHYQPLRRGDETVGIIGSAIDITDAKHAQEELARAVAFRERVMGVLGHDLRNPLNMVLMQAQLMQRQPGMSDQAREGIARIARAAERMDEMIGTLLDVTRLRAGRHLRLSIETVDLDTVVHAVVDELHVAHRDRAIEVTGNGDLRGRWDAARIAQVVSNLVANALTHGSVDAPIQLSLFEDGESVALAVTNRGPTIPDDAIGRLFEPFWQAPGGDGAPRRDRGLGLGLYIVREIVAAHGGTIDVSSRDGVTTFTVRLPRSVRLALDAFDAAPPH